MRSITRIVTIVALALAAMPAEASDRTDTRTYNTWNFTTINEARGLPGPAPGWNAVQVFTPEDAVSISISDVTGRPVAGFVTQAPSIPSLWTPFCGSIDNVGVGTGEDGFGEVYIAVIAEHGGTTCAQSSVPVRGTITTTFHEP